MTNDFDPRVARLLEHRLWEHLLHRSAEDYLQDAERHLAEGDKTLARLSLTLAMHARTFVH